MENVKKSKRIALGLIEETKDIYSPEYTPTENYKCVDIDEPSTSKMKRQTEIVKYGKITFNTTAILHHYPQIANNERSKLATKQTDLNPPELKVNNNNELKKDKDKKDNYNNNDTVEVDITTDNAIEMTHQPVKFTEEKLV